jgi:hypothetical protein
VNAFHRKPSYFRHAAGARQIVDATVCGFSSVKDSEVLKPTISVPTFVLERKARLQLQQLIADGNTPQKIVKRARIILMTADGHGVMANMREVGVSKTRTQTFHLALHADVLLLAEPRRAALHRNHPTT